MSRSTSASCRPTRREAASQPDPGTILAAQPEVDGALVTPRPNQHARVGAVIFDVDGVLVASPHERAWQDALAALMAGDWRSIAPATTYTPERFTTAVYQAYVAGKPRL